VSPKKEPPPKAISKRTAARPWDYLFQLKRLLEFLRIPKALKRVLGFPLDVS